MTDAALGNVALAFDSLWKLFGADFGRTGTEYEAEDADAASPRPALLWLAVSPELANQIP